MSKPLFSWRTALASKNGPESATTRHVLLTISLHMGERGESCFPSLQTLSSETGYSKSTVARHIKKAEGDGWIHRKRRKRESGADSSTIYRPGIPEEFEMDGGGPCCTDEHGVLQSETRGVAEEDTNVNSTTNNSLNAPAREEELPHHERDEPPCTMESAIEKGQMVGVPEKLCKEWWLYYDQKGWPFEVKSVGSALRKWKMNDKKFNPNESTEDVPDDDPYGGQRDYSKNRDLI